MCVCGEQFSVFSFLSVLSDVFRGGCCLLCVGRKGGLMCFVGDFGAGVMISVLGECGMC